MVEGWIKVYDADEEYQGALVKQLLEREGINAVLLDKKDDEFRIGHVEVYVSPDDADKAKSAIIANRS